MDYENNIENVGSENAAPSEPKKEFETRCV